MKIIRPKIWIINSDEIDEENILRKLEKIGRVCYKSEDKITLDSAKKFIKTIIERGHESIIEHCSISVRIICDRGVSHELVRHRLASYSQESTRYCNYSGGVTFIIPPWVNLPEGEIEEGTIETPVELIKALQEDSPRGIWIRAMDNSETFYKNLLKKGWSPQHARSVLPNSLKTEIIMTTNLREWRYFFRLRTAKAAHPQMREIARPMLKKFQELIPIIFDDITYEA